MVQFESRNGEGVWQANTPSTTDFFKSYTILFIEVTATEMSQRKKY